MKNRTEKELHHWDKLRNKGQGDDPSWQSIWDAADQYGRNYQPDVEAGLRRLKHKMAAGEPATAKVVQLSSTKWLRNIAAVGVLLLLTWAGLSILGNKTDATTKWVEVQTTENEVRELILPDGSSITLNENSHLAYQADLNEAETREIRLSGEAYFDVERRPNQAFNITTDRTEISVLGTSFNVRAFTEETNTEIEVTSGRVAVRSLLKNEEVILGTKEAVVLDESNKLLEQEAPFLNRQAWRTGQITFRETPAAEVLLILTRFYDVDFARDISLINCRLTGSWDNEPLEVVLEAIETFTPLQINEVGKGVYQVNGSCD